MLIRRKRLFWFGVGLLFVGASCLVLPPYQAYCNGNHANNYYCAAYEVVVTLGEFVDSHNGAVTAIATAFLTVVTAGLVYIARLQTETTRAQLRARIIVGGLGIKPFKPGGSVIHYSIENVGQLSATNVEWGLEAEFSCEERREKFSAKWDDVRGKFVVAPGLSMRRAYVFFPKEIEIHRFLNEKWVLYVFGEVRYLDGFNTRRWTRFCHRYGLGRGVVVPLENESEIPADRMKYHQYGNETDDEG